MDADAPRRGGHQSGQDQHDQDPRRQGAPGPLACPDELRDVDSGEPPRLRYRGALGERRVGHLPGRLAAGGGIGAPARIGSGGGPLGGVSRGGHAEVRQCQLVGDRVEFGAHLRGVGEAFVGVARGGPGDEPIELRGHAGNDRTGRSDVAVEAGVGDRQRVVAGERSRPGEQFEGHHAQRVDVTARPGGRTDDLFGGEIGGRAEDHAGGGDARLGDGPHQTEVDQLHFAVVGDQHVLRFEVAVHQAGPVGGAQPAEQRAEHGHDRVRRHRAAFSQQFPQGPALDEFHHQVGVRRVVVAVVHGDQPGVLEACHRAGFPPEPGQELVVAGIAGIHHLQRDRPFQPHVETAVDRRHSAGRDPGIDAIAPVEHGADEGVRHHRHMVGPPAT